jgi:hypothetical protein
MLRFIRVIIAMELLVVMLANALWLVVWQRVGCMPRYGHPESWSTPPLSDHPILTLFCGVQGLAFGWAGVPATLVLIYRAYRPDHRRSDVVWAFVACMATALAWWDPTGAIDWYVD